MPTKSIKIHSHPAFLSSLDKTLNLQSKKQTLIATQISDCEINIPENTDLTFITILKKGWEGTKTLNFNFKGRGSNINFLALIIGKRKEKFTLRTNSNHFAGETKAYYTVKTVLFDQCEMDYVGFLNIHKRAQMIDSHLSHHTLLLSPDAKVKTVPSLEIEADDVKAGHSASIGHLDDEILFYLKSRGICEKEAKSLLVEGFIKSDLGIIDDLKIRKTLEKELSII
ncbi:SufD family Fe-S cluster assembly protein [Candidatus Peregrinibacteria bacterium]|nr:SufD family Fe-S cluster assembly protein [Candidatus Peregrinibacteria bacterium]